MNRPIHFEILTDHPEAVGQFYRDVLGWEMQDPGGPEQYWLLTTGKSEGHGIDGGIMHRHFPQRVVNTIEVADLEETLAKVEQAGGKKIHGPSEIPNVGLHAYCADPDGNMFGLLQPPDESG